MSDFKKMCVTSSILNLQKCDAYQNGVEFRHKPYSDDAKCPSPLYFASHGPWAQEIILVPNGLQIHTQTKVVFIQLTNQNNIDQVQQQALYIHLISLTGYACFESNL